VLERLPYDLYAALLEEEQAPARQPGGR
jgi:hypothetical protein